jgi:hypothetical protein
MSTITFDTFEFNSTLREGGFDEKQAAALTKAQAKAASQIHDTGEYATKNDILDVRKDMAELKSEIFKAMMVQTMAIAGIVIAVVKFMH